MLLLISTGIARAWTFTQLKTLQFTISDVIALLVITQTLSDSSTNARRVKNICSGDGDGNDDKNDSGQHHHDSYRTADIVLTTSTQWYPTQRHWRCRQAFSRRLQETDSKNQIRWLQHTEAETLNHERHLQGQGLNPGEGRIRCNLVHGAV